MKFLFFVFVLGVFCVNGEIQIPKREEFTTKRALRLTKDEYCTAPMPQFIELSENHAKKKLSMVCERLKYG